MRGGEGSAGPPGPPGHAAARGLPEDGSCWGTGPSSASRGHLWGGVHLLSIPARLTSGSCFPRGACTPWSIPKMFPWAVSTWGRPQMWVPLTPFALPTMARGMLGAMLGVVLGALLGGMLGMMPGGCSGRDAGALHPAPAPCTAAGPSSRPRAADAGPYGRRDYWNLIFR